MSFPSVAKSNVILLVICFFADSSQVHGNSVNMSQEVFVSSRALAGQWTFLNETKPSITHLLHTRSFHWDHPVAGAKMLVKYAGPMSLGGPPAEGDSPLTDGENASMFYLKK